MAGEYLPPVVLKITADIDGLVAKMDAAEAKYDEFLADMKAKSEAMKAGGDLSGKGGGVGGAFGAAGMPHTIQAWLASQGGANDVLKTFTTRLGNLKQTVTGSLQSGLEDLSNNLKNVAGGLAVASAALGGSSGSIFNQIMGFSWSSLTSGLSSAVGLFKTWAVMIPTVAALPALLGAIGGAAGGLAASFTVASTAIGIFAIGAMQAMSYVTSVSTMAGFDALSAPLQKLYYAYHNLSNEMTLMSPNAGGSTTIVSTLTNMFNTFGTVLQRIAPVMGEIASAGQAAFNVLSVGLLGSKFTTFIDWVGASATPVLTTFSQTFVNLAEGWTSLMEDLSPAMTLFDNGMVKLTQTFANWAASPKGTASIEGFVNYVKNAWPDVSKFWGGLGHIISELFSSTAKYAPQISADLGKMFDSMGNGLGKVAPLIAKMIPGLLTGLTQLMNGFMTGLTPALKALGDGLGKNHLSMTQLGKDMGIFVGHILEAMPSILKLVDTLTQWINPLLRSKGLVEGLFIAWASFRALRIGGAISSDLSNMIKLTGTATAGLSKLMGLGASTSAAAGEKPLRAASQVLQLARGAPLRDLPADLGWLAVSPCLLQLPSELELRFWYSLTPPSRTQMRSQEHLNRRASCGATALARCRGSRRQGPPRRRSTLLPRPTTTTSPSTPQSPSRATPTRKPRLRSRRRSKLVIQPWRAGCCRRAEPTADGALTDEGPVRDRAGRHLSRRVPTSERRAGDQADDPGRRAGGDRQDQMQHVRRR
jgi:hypothetical protein